jgi:hypothetical protein
MRCPERGRSRYLGRTGEPARATVAGTVRRVLRRRRLREQQPAPAMPDGRRRRPESLAHTGRHRQQTMTVSSRMTLTLSVTSLPKNPTFWRLMRSR